MRLDLVRLHSRLVKMFSAGVSKANVGKNHEAFVEVREDSRLTHQVSKVLIVKLPQHISVIKNS